MSQVEKNATVGGEDVEKALPTKVLNTKAIVLCTLYNARSVDILHLTLLPTASHLEDFFS
jgi:hypothetical protein